MTAAAGDDDVIPRAYRDGDELRRVHWRSTARYGELMVRREEQRWQDRAVLVLDTRRAAHGGAGPNSSFEFAVSAAASIGVHLARAGLDGHLLTDSGPLAGSAMFEDVLLDALSVVAQSRNHDFARTTAALSTIEGGLIVLIAGRLSAAAAREIAAARRDGRHGIALLLAVSTWDRPAPSNGQQPAPAQPADATKLRRFTETDTAEAVLRAAGWRVVSVGAGTPLAVAWQQLPRYGGLTIPAAVLAPTAAALPELSSSPAGPPSTDPVISPPNGSAVAGSKPASNGSAASPTSGAAATGGTGPAAVNSGSAGQSGIDGTAVR